MGGRPKQTKNKPQSPLRAPPSPPQPHAGQHLGQETAAWGVEGLLIDAHSLSLPPSQMPVLVPGG